MSHVYSVIIDQSYGFLFTSQDDIKKFVDKSEEDLLVSLYFLHKQKMYNPVKYLAQVAETFWRYPQSNFFQFENLYTNSPLGLYFLQLC